MLDPTPEETQRISREEKARLEAQEEIKAEQSEERLWAITSRCRRGSSGTGASLDKLPIAVFTSSYFIFIALPVSAST
jgi:hypothetical protein